MRATIGITAGDPAGIGLEVILKSVSSVLNSARWVLFTNRDIFHRNAMLFPPDVPIRWIDDVSEISDEPALFLIDVAGLSGDIEFGKLTSTAGQRALAYLETASREALAGRIGGIVTAPVSKEAIGGTFRGQTDLLAERAHVDEYAMA